jgi:hypothetical protein
VYKLQRAVGSPINTSIQGKPPRTSDRYPQTIERIFKSTLSLKQYEAVGVDTDCSASVLALCTLVAPAERPPVIIKSNLVASGKLCALQARGRFR